MFCILPLKCLTNFNLMIQRTCIANSKNTFDRAKSDVVCAENQSFDSGVDECTGAHRARFNSRINGRFSQPIIADFCGGFAQNQNFSVRCRIAIGNCPVSGDG